MDQDDFRGRVIDSLARLETNVGLLVDEVHQHRARLDKIERWQFRFGVAGAMCLVVLAAIGGKASTLLRAALAMIEKG